MVNLDHAEVRHAIMLQVFDFLLGKDDRDWSTNLHELYGARAEGAENRRKAMIEARKEDRPATIDISEITGTYENEFLGKVTLAFTDNQLVGQFRSDRNASFVHWHDNTYMVKLIEYAHDRGDLIDFDRHADESISFKFAGYTFKKQK